MKKQSFMLPSARPKPENLWLKYLVVVCASLLGLGILVLLIIVLWPNSIIAPWPIGPLAQAFSKWQFANFGVLWVLLPGLLIYLIPSWIAVTRKASHMFSITALNVLLGWTLLGWFAALLWACMDKSES